MRRKLTAVLLATMLLVTAFAPAAVSAQEIEPTDLDVTLVQNPETGNVTVTVTNGSAPVEGATVNVTSGVTYTGEGTYTTDADGTLALPNPDQPLGVEVEVTHSNVTTTKTFTLVPVEDSIDVRITQNDDGTVALEATQFGDALADAEVEVTSTVAYTGNGTYTTDANGTVALPEPAEATDITAVVTSGDLEAIQTETIEPIAEFEVGAETNDDGTATVTVTRDDAAVENATVNVTSTAAYAGNGTYTTDTNGTVALPEPAANLTVTVTASDEGDEATTDVELSPVDTGLAVDVVQNSDGTATVTVTDDGSAVENATVNVTSNVAYDGNGTYETSAGGTVGLPAPDQNITVTVTATNESESATTTADLEHIENGGYANFGQWISSYVQDLKSEGYFGKEFGQKVSEFATENNPGADNKPDHAGPPERDDADNVSEDVDAEDEESDDEKRRGPPEHAQGNADKHDDDETEDADEAETEDADEAETESEDDADCDVDSDDSDCADETEDTEDDESDEREDENEDDDDDDDAPGNSGNRGNSGNSGNNGNGNGNGRK